MMMTYKILRNSLYGSMLMIDGDKKVVSKQRFASFPKVDLLQF